MERILIAHDGEYIDGMKEVLLQKYPNILEKEKIATASVEFLFDRLVDEEKPFDLLIATSESNLSLSFLGMLKKRTKHAPRRIVSMCQSAEECCNGIEIIHDIQNI
jgi:hypothetical protein